MLFLILFGALLANAATVKLGRHEQFTLYEGTATLKYEEHHKHEHITFQVFEEHGRMKMLVECSEKEVCKQHPEGHEDHKLYEKIHKLHQIMKHLKRKEHEHKNHEKKEAHKEVDHEVDGFFDDLFGFGDEHKNFKKSEHEERKRENQEWDIHKIQEHIKKVHEEIKHLEREDKHETKLGHIAVIKSHGEKIFEEHVKEHHDRCFENHHNKKGEEELIIEGIFFLEY